MYIIYIYLFIKIHHKQQINNTDCKRLQIAIYMHDAYLWVRLLEALLLLALLYNFLFMNDCNFYTFTVYIFLCNKQILNY